ncbi:MAG: ScyD/ScyE family protein [Jatrophihabitans sp.]|uniref:ScyD/ScyE family protein n=1 Tax=Jatrophihabitans sp. TaxID=1932789 RepID=UPI003F7E5F0D
MRTTFRTRGPLAVVAAGVLLVGAAQAADARGTPRFSVVVSGLAAPRGITFDARGTMYVAESGVAGSGENGLTDTGAVSAYRWGHTVPSWTTGFSSLYSTEDPSAPPDVLGPEGLSALSHGCRMRHDACRVRLITSESTPGILAATHGAVDDPQAGRLFGLDPRSGHATELADVGSQSYAFTTANQALFPSDFPDSNPFGVLVTRGRHGAVRTFVADAGANTISEIGRDGSARVIAYIPNETGGAMRDATPTCIAEGPDGWLYVGTLDLVSNLFIGLPGGQSHVYRVNPDANFPTVPSVWASGLTTVTGCTFDDRGNFWATEMFAGGADAATPGDVVRIPFRHPDQQTHYGAGTLVLPGSIAQGPDDALYVTVGSSAPGRNGAVVRMSLGRH